jgi:hypothetical protein
MFIVFSEGWPRSRSDHGYVGVLDARLLLVPHGRISDCGINLVRRFRKRGAALHGGHGIHRLRNSLVRNGPSALGRVAHGTRRMDGDRIFLHFGACLARPETFPL